MRSFRKFFYFFIINSLWYSHGETFEARSPQFNLNRILEELLNFSFGPFKIGSYASDCRIDIQNHLLEPPPLLLYPGTTKIYNPQPNGELVIPYNGKIEFNCQQNLLEPFHDKNKVVAQCIGLNRLKVDGKIYDITDFVCNSWFPSVAQRTHKTCHYGNATEIEVGFQLKSDKRFIRIFDLCHDEEIGSTLYVHHYLTPGSNSFQSGVKRVSFRKGNFYGKLNVDGHYKQVKQKDTIGRILGGNHEKYFDEKSSLFLARGHLSAKADHVYANEQRGTFYYVNAAPQWQSFNAGNWQTIEDDIRRYAQKKRLYLECFTGTWGIGTLADGNGDHRELYLYFDENENGGLIPVPKIYYRVVIDIRSRKGIVLIGVNNPHLTMEEIQRDYIICNDISDKINYIDWKRDNIRLGYSYACEVKEFMKVVGHLENLNVKGPIKFLYQLFTTSVLSYDTKSSSESKSSPPITGCRQTGKHFLVHFFSSGPSKNTFFEYSPIYSIKILESIPVPEYAGFECNTQDVKIFKNLEKRAALSSKFPKWPNAIVPYLIQCTDFKNKDLDLIKEALNEIQNKTCLKFVQIFDRTQFNGFIIVDCKYGGGCNAKQGYKGVPQILNLEKQSSNQTTRGGCMKFHIIQHEFMHALGFAHEHNSPIRNQFVKILSQNIAPGREYYFKVNNAVNYENYGCLYDYQSIMQVDEYRHSRNNKPTIVSRNDSFPTLLFTEKMSFQTLFVLCLGIAFTPWLEAREYQTIPSIIEDDLPEIQWNLNNYNIDEQFVSKECTFNVNKDIKDPQPLYLVPNSIDFYEPDTSGNVHIPNGKQIEFHCTKGFASPFLNLKNITSKCKGGTSYEVSGKIYNFTEFICTKTNDYIARPTTKKCYNNSMIAEIGFEIINKKFVKLMEICHDEISASTYYVQHNMGPFNNKYQRNVTRPYFQQGKFFKKLNINKLYTQNEQIKTVGRILGGNHEKYFDIDKYVYLARGHLAAKTDYVYGVQQLGTFFYINVAPQWQTFNSGNWLAVEDGVRNFIAKKKLYVDLYTGTWGVSSLKDSKGVFRELYLYNTNDNSKNQVPVPKLFYKIVIDRKSRKGIVLIGVNNPHLTLEEIENDYIICNDISNQINWLKWKKDNITNGYSYACSIPDFVKVVKHLPKLNVKGILL
ncbi:uncharacterized protein LOC129606599 [Condylostylus longicornis]|uniref:uncharacterized protein LOC129606599 n=1 Tax=Condylostylus longicornis TaxID=2530218 RepID=UPI00244E5585|nr:uncharacterized protein LOC129606599 [Condylostylus longicornis]